MKLEQTPNQSLAAEFAQFVKGFQQTTPPTRRAVTSSPFGKLTDQAVAKAWDETGQHYPSVETPETFAITMLVLLDHLKKPRGKERWLSVGSGPGLYEMFLAKLFPEVTIESVDQSAGMIDVQKQFLTTQPKKIRDRVSTHVAGMCQLDDPDNSFDRIFAINCLQWVIDWRVGLDNLGRMLSKRPGSPIYLVVAGASYINDGVRHYISVDLEEDSLDEQLRKLQLQPTHRGNLIAEVGQFGKPASRFYTVGKRVAGKIPLQPAIYSNYEITTDIRDDVEVIPTPDRKSVLPG